MVRRIIAIYVVLTLALTTVPVFADGVAQIYASVEVDSDTRTIRIQGVVNGSGQYLSVYLLFPDKKIADIPYESPENRVISHLGQPDIQSGGTFQYQFRYAGNNGVYTLCLKSGNQYAQCTVDTTISTDSTSAIKALKLLPVSYPALDGATVRERFMQARAELPEEIPVVLPMRPSGYRKLFVSPDGTKDGDGSLNNPYASVQAALADIDFYSGTAIYLRGGTYSYNDIGVLADIEADENFPLYISAYENEEVIVEGGRRIKGNTFDYITDTDVLNRLSPLVHRKVLCVDLESLGITYEGTFTTEMRPALYVDDTEYTIARWPNGTTTPMREYTGTDGENGVVDSGPITTGIGSRAGDYRTVGKYGEKGFEIAVEDLRPFGWANAKDVWLYGSFYSEWTKNHVRIKSINSKRRSVRTETGLMWGAVYDEKNQFYYYNVLEELDIPGEWYADKESGMLYLYPHAELADASVMLVDRSEPAVSISNSKNILLNGILFEKVMNSAVRIQDCEGVILQNCTIDGCGGNAVEILGSSRYCGVTTSNIQNAGGDAFRVYADDATLNTLIPQRNFLQNSYVYNCSAVRVKSIGSIISHNVVSNSVGSSIYLLGGAENICEYNEILCGPREIDDAGAIYVRGGNASHCGNHVRYNYMHHIGVDKGIYYDDMLSGNYAYGNILDGTRIFIHNGSDNSIYNNIILNVEKAPIEESINYFRTYDERWIRGALEYGSISAYIKSGYAEREPWKSRYPMLYQFTKLMKLRIEEYANDADKALISDINVDYATGTVVSGTVIYTTAADRLVNLGSGDGRFDTTNTKTDLETYLRAPRYQHIENNLMINTSSISITKLGQRSATLTDNKQLTSAQNPFVNGDYASVDNYNTVRQHMPNFEDIPFEKIGIIVGESAWNTYAALSRTDAVSPPDGSSGAVFSNDVTLVWSSVPCAGEYIVELASDRAFNNIVARYTTYDMQYAICDSSIAFNEGTTYYWRVTCKALSDDVIGEQTVSDTFAFTTASESVTALVEHNSVGVTEFKSDLSGEKMKLEFTPYNANATDLEADAYVAVYDEDQKLLSVQMCPISIPANDFAEEIKLSFDEKTGSTVRVYIWSAPSDGLVPYAAYNTYPLK